MNEVKQNEYKEIFRYLPIDFDGTFFSLYSNGNATVFLVSDNKINDVIKKSIDDHDDNE